MSKYTQRKDNEGFEVPNGEIYKLACCDCGLVHQIVILAPGIKKGTPLGMAAKRDNRATAARRRAKPNRHSAPATWAGANTTEGIICRITRNSEKNRKAHVVG